MERKNRKMWIVVVIAVMMVCLATGAVSAEEYPTNPYQEKVWNIDRITKQIGKRGDQGYWQEIEWIVIEEIQAPSLTQHGKWRITMNDKPADLGAVTERAFYLQSVDPSGNFSTEYRFPTTSDTIESCDIVAPGRYRLIAEYDFENQQNVQIYNQQGDIGYGNHYDFTVDRGEGQTAQNYPTVTERAEQIVQECQVSGDKWETALNLHDWLTLNAYYDKTYSFYGAEDVLLRGCGVCDSYSKAYMLLCQKAGIPVRRVTGYAGERHAWNAIQLNGEWYLVDTTWDDPVITGKETTTITGSEKHEFFCLNDELMGLDHTNDGTQFANGQCNSLEANYLLKTGIAAWDAFGDRYIKNGQVYRYSDSMRTQLETETTFTINCEQTYYAIKETNTGYNYNTAAATSARAKRCWTLLAMSMSKTPFVLSNDEVVNVTVNYNRDDRCFSGVVRNNALDTPTMTLPENAIAGEPIIVTINGVENADYYTLKIIGGQYGEAAPEERTIFYEGEYTLEEFGLDEGNYSMTLTAGSNGSYADSEAMSYTLSVTGDRPAAPTIQMPEGTIYQYDSVWITTVAEGADAIMYQADHETSEYMTQNGTAVIPYRADYTTHFVFRAKSGRAWSQETEVKTLTVTEQADIGHLELTVPATSLQGQNVTVSGITELQGAGRYAFSLGKYDKYKGTEVIVYDEPFEITYDEQIDVSSGAMTIPGYYFMEPGQYVVTVTAYHKITGYTVGEGTKRFTVTANSNIPGKPTVTLAEDEDSYNIYGKTHFTVTTTNGADQIYAFVCDDEDELLGEYPVDFEPNSSENIYACQMINRRTGSLLVYFAVCKGGTWSETSEPISYNVYGAGTDNILNDPVLNCPKEAVLGDEFTVQWNTVEHAEWYELEVWRDDEIVSSEMISATQGTTATFSRSISTEGIIQSGRYTVEVYAYAEEYDSGDGGFAAIDLLDPSMKIRVTGVQAESTAMRVQLTLANVTANQLRIRVDGADIGVLGIRPQADGRMTLSIPVPSFDSQIQVANYDTDPRKWGAWSDPVKANDIVLDPAKTLVLPDELVRIEANAFEGIDAEAVIIPDSCTEIGAEAFKNCLKLKYVSYKEGTIVADDAFVRTVTNVQCPEIKITTR